MGGSPNYPADRKLTSQIDYDGKVLLDGNVKAKTPLNKLLSDLSNLAIDFDKAIALERVNEEYPVFEGASGYKGADAIAMLFNRLGDAVTDMSKIIGDINTNLEDGNDISSALYKVKVNPSDEEGKYLTDKITSEQSGTIDVQDNKNLYLKGLVPLGFVGFVTKSSLSYFDGTGKGKASTPYYGWAVSNGQNGTDNLMKGRYLRIPSTLDDASKEDGSAEFTVNLKNVESFEVPVTGSLGNGGSATQRFITKLKKFVIGSSTAKNTTVYSPTGPDGEDNVSSENTDISHTHSSTLKSSHVNNSPVPIKLAPSAVNLIPIQKINV